MKIHRFTFGITSLVITVTVFVILCKLGFWQLDRAAQKLAILSAHSATDIITEPSLKRYFQPSSLLELHGQQVSFDAELDTNQIWLLDNKTHQGKVGYSVMVPARIPSLNRYVFVDVGWWPAPQSRDELPHVELPLTLTVTGRVRSKDFDGFSLGESVLPETWPKRIQTLRTALDYAYSFDVLPLIVYSHTDTIVGHPQLYNPVVMPPEKHKAYALQWFLLAGFSLVVFVAASYRNHKGEHNYEI